jgi:hypothetical protein
MYLDFNTMADRELKEIFLRDDFIFDDSDESLLDLDQNLSHERCKKVFKGLH